jgi:hypothetical protein
MKLKIYIFPNFKTSGEFLTISHFLRWQGIPFKVIEDPNVLQMTQGKSKISIGYYTADDEPIVGFNGFFGFFEWMKNTGALIC